MGKNKMRNIIAISIVITAAIILCSCGKNSSKDPVHISSYRYDPIELAEDKDMQICVSCYKDDILYYIRAHYEAGKGMYGYEMCRYDCSTGEVSVLFRPDDAIRCDDIYIDENGQFNVLYVDHDMYLNHDGMECGDMYLIRYSETGEELLRKELSGVIRENDGGNYKGNICKFDANGAIYIASTESVNIYRYDNNGNNTSIFRYNDCADDILEDENGNPVIITKMDDGILCTVCNADSGETIRKMKIENVKDRYIFGNGSIHGDGEHNYVFQGNEEPGCLYVKDADWLCSYDTATGEIISLFDWNETGLVEEYVTDIIPISNGSFLCGNDNTNDSFEYNVEYGIIRKLDSPKEKTVIRCATLGTGALDSDGTRAYRLQKKITEYNRKHDDIYVDYVSYEKSDNPISAFAQDVISENVPDVIDISSVDVDSYISKGFFEDLTPYMENDELLNKEWFVDGLPDVTAVDGKQYYVIKSFTIDTIAGRSSDMSKYSDGWNMKDMLEYFNSKAEGTRLCIDYTKEKIFDEFITGIIKDCVDWNTGEVNFDCEEFRQFAKICKSAPDNPEYTEGSNGELYLDYNIFKKEIKEGKLLLNISPLTLTCEDYQLNKALFGNDLIYVGYPSKDRTLSYIEPCNQSLAISASSEHKEEAWDFLKYIITEKITGELSMRDSYPAGKGDFNRMVRMMTATEEYTDEDGYEVRPLNGNGGMGGLDFEIKPYSREDIRTIKKLIAGGRIRTKSHELSDIIKEEMYNYYNGRTLDEVIHSAGDRVSKYVNENR